MNVKKRRIIIIFSALLIIALFSLFSYIIDSYRVDNNLAPIFIIHTEKFDDGGTAAYYGLGYQIIKWNRISSDSPDYVLVGVEKHYIFGFNTNMNEPKIDLSESKSSGSEEINFISAAQKAAEIQSEYTDVVATVNGKAILESNLILKKHYLEVGKIATLEQIDKMRAENSIDDATREQYIADTNKNYVYNKDDVLNDLIRAEVMLQKADELGIMATDEEALNKANNVMRMLKESMQSSDPSSKESAVQNYKILTDYMVGFNMTEDEYIKQMMAPTYKKDLSKSNLAEYYIGDDQDLTPDQKKEKLNSIIDDLVAKAEIVIK